MSKTNILDDESAMEKNKSGKVDRKFGVVRKFNRVVRKGQPEKVTSK